MADLYFDDFVVGYVEESPSVRADRAEMIRYAVENDPYPFHIDEGAAAASPFGGIIASFGYTVSLFYRCQHSLQISKDFANSFLGGLGWTVRLGSPVRPDDEIHDRLEIVSLRLTSKGDRGVVVSRHDLTNQAGDVPASIDVTSLIARRPT